MIAFIKSFDAYPRQGILVLRTMGASKTLPVLNEIARSVVAPTIVVYLIQSALTSASITPATTRASPIGAVAPFQVTCTTSITRSSAA